MSPKLRSNWRRPNSQSGSAEVTHEPEPNTETANPAAQPETPREEAEQPKPRARRAPARSRSSAAATKTETEPQSVGSPDAAAAAPKPARRRPSRARSAAAAQIDEANANQAPAPSGHAESQEAQPAAAEQQPARASDADAARHNPTADAARTLLRRVLPMRRHPDEQPGDQRTAEEPATPYRAHATRWSPPVQDFEPMPPPTKRKAPRAGTTGTRQPSTENAVDWALGRATTPQEEVGGGEMAAGPAGRRRRSRRGGRGRLNGEMPDNGEVSGNGEVAGNGEMSSEDLALLDAAMRQGRTRPASAPAAAASERSQPRFRQGQPPAVVEGDRSQPRFRAAQAQPAPVREDRGRSQLNTLESLVARQNVVMDALLAKVSSFSNIENALLTVERRLAGQASAGAGIATPRVGIFVDVPNIIYAAERIGVAIDFGKLLHYLSRGRELVRASAYAPVSDDPMARLDTQKFVQPFVHRGYRIMTKPLKRFSDGTMKGNFDVELAMDVLTMSDRLDIISLVSGDGDFSRLVEIVGSKGVRVEVVAFGASTSAELRNICDDYIDMQEHLQELI